MRVFGCLLFTTLLSSSFGGVFADDGSAPPATRVTPLVPPEDIWHPSAVPDRIVLSWERDPATSMAVTWRTDTTVRQAVAEFALAEDGPKFVEKTRRVDAISESLDTDLGPSLRHSVIFGDLQPATQYVYRVGDGTNWSEWAGFQSAASTAEPFSFVYFGDAQNDLKSHWSRVVRRAFRDAPEASFFLHAGDLVNRSESDAEWGEWFYAGGFIHRSTPCVATPGNHEFGRVAPESDERRLSIHWRPGFTFPQNGPDGLKESTYWFDYQGTRFISLNSTEKHEVQAKWLDEVLAQNTARWTVVTFHHPVYSSKAGRDNPHLRRLWQPVIDRHRVDLVLQGHDHTYARSQLMTSESNLTTGVTHHNPETGTVYVVSVSGPKMYDLGRRPFMRRAAEDTQLFQIITIDGWQMKYEARTATGRLYDGFILRKDRQGRKTLIEQIPGTPENRRPEKEPEEEQSPEQLVREWMQLDKNKDRKLTRDELPVGLRVYFPEVDVNKDGVCTFDELLAAARSVTEAR